MTNATTETKLKYYAAMLHIDHDDLTPDEYYMLGFYRKWIGLNGEPCDLPLKQIVPSLKWNENKKRSVRNSLVARGVINVIPSDGKPCKVVLVDRVAQNIEVYKSYVQSKSDVASNRPVPKSTSTQIEPPSNSDVNPLPNQYEDVLPNQTGVQAQPLKEDQEEYKNQESISSEIDMRPAPQPQDMVSDDANSEKPNQPDPTVVEEMHEEPLTPVPPPPSPSVVTVNKHRTTVITPRDPIFDSVACLQFGVPVGETVPKGTAGRIGKIVKVIVDAYKQRNNVTALSPHEREGLAGIHAKFWQWFTTVRYPQSGRQRIELKAHTTFEDYWYEYRRYTVAQTVKPDYSDAAEWRYQDDDPTN